MRKIFFKFLLFLHFSEELHQSQLLINELQRKLAETNKNSRSNGDTLENFESIGNCCTKCNEEIELKIRQIENFKMYIKI